MKYQYARIFIWLVHINLVVICTWQLRPMHICMLQVGRWCWYANFACYSCCIKMTLIVYVWISFLLVSAEQIWVAIRVHISFVVVLILIICRPQIISVFSSWTLTSSWTLPTCLSMWSKHVLFTRAKLVNKYLLLCSIRFRHLCNKNVQNWSLN